MASGLFGKLPAKRDFVSNGAPRRFLDVYEGWLQGGIASSRQSMGAGWQDAYLRMPIWRFWLGSAYCGATAMGAFMPSVDAVGRYFPLSIFAIADGESFLPPELDPADAWFGAVEATLLDALDPAAPYERLLAAVAALPDPPSRTPAVAGVRRLSFGAVAAVDPPVPIADTFAAARIAAHAAHHARQCCLWTAGGDGFPPMLLVDARLPDPARFPALITGELDPAATPEPSVVGGWT